MMNYIVVLFSWTIYDNFLLKSSLNFGLCLWWHILGNVVSWFCISYPYDARRIFDLIKGQTIFIMHLTCSILYIYITFVITYVLFFCFIDLEPVDVECQTHNLKRQKVKNPYRQYRQHVVNRKVWFNLRRYWWIFNI